MKDRKKTVGRDDNTISRRGFMGVAAGAAMAATTVTSLAQGQSLTNAKDSTKFKLKYAPHFGMFKQHAGKDHIDQIKFMADQGFTAMEDNGMMKRPKDLQEKIAQENQNNAFLAVLFVELT